MTHLDHPDLMSLLPRMDFTRRAMIVTSLATGFALAVHPISAQTITTASDGLTAGEVKIPTPDGEIPGYRAMPEVGGPFPVVLVVQEIFGVHEHIKDICRRFAKLGYFAVSAELFARQGDVSKIADVKDIMPIVAEVPDTQVMSDLDATVAWAKATGKGDSAHLGITGFCWGGRIVWLYAAHNPKLRAGVAWYGPLNRNTTALQPQHPLNVAADLKAPVLGLYAGKDKGIPASDIEKMRTALKKARPKSEIMVYPDAQHGFNADYRPSYNAADAQDGWKRMLSWFKDHGVRAG
ncbi:MAG TPA: dienelactone hydrolase family protein [Steroidobacteraceae bacterium]